MTSWSEGTSPLPDDANKTSDEAQSVHDAQRAMWKALTDSQRSADGKVDEATPTPDWKLAHANLLMLICHWLYAISQGSMESAAIATAESGGNQQSAAARRCMAQWADP